MTKWPPLGSAALGTKPVTQTAWPPTTVAVGGGLSTTPRLRPTEEFQLCWLGLEAVSSDNQGEKTTRRVLCFDALDGVVHALSSAPVLRYLARLGKGWATPHRR